jgi:hypothetical protein
MSSFGENQLGPWPDQFKLHEDFGCLPTIIGFFVFIAVLAVLRHFLFE